MKLIHLILLVTAFTVGYACEPNEKELYLSNHASDETHFFEFNLTSVETELFYEIEEIRYGSIIEILKERIEKEITDEEARAIREKAEKASDEAKQKWEKRKKEAPEGAQLYFVSFRNGEGSFTGHYFILNGEIVWKNLYEW